MNIENDLGRLILKLSHTVIKNRNHHLEALHITASQADSLNYLMENDKIDIKDLKDHLCISHQTAQGLVLRMEAKGLVSVKQSSRDRRHKEISVSRKGKALGRQINANRVRTAKLLLNGMTESERDMFIKLLQAAYDNVKEDGAKDEKGNLK